MLRANGAWAAEFRGPTESTRRGENPPEVPRFLLYKTDGER